MLEKNQNEGFRRIFYYKNYYLDFFEKLPIQTRKKFNWTLQLLASLEKIPDKYFKHISGSSGIYEIRVESGSNIYRVFSFFDKGNLIILINAFQKKTQKTPRAELQKAEKLKAEYFKDRRNK